MLKVVALMGQHKFDMSSLAPETTGGSITDYSVPGSRILHWMLKENFVEIFSSDKGVSIEQGVIRATVPEKVTLLRKLLPGETYELPFQSRYGDAVLVFTYEK